MSGSRRIAMCALCVASSTFAAAAAWCQERAPAADVITPYPDRTLAEPADHSPQVVPYPPQPTVSIGGPFGIVTGGGFGLRIGGPNGVHIGGGRGVQIGPPANGAALTQLDSMEAAPGMRDQLTLRYPESALNDLQFRVNGSAMVLAPGEIIQIPTTEPVVVRVPRRKGGWGFARSLPAGHYVFGQTARGWRLFRDDSAMVYGTPAEQIPGPDASPDLQPSVIESSPEPAPTTASPPTAEPPAEEIPVPNAGRRTNPQSP